MAYNEKLTNRLRQALADVPNVEEKRMFSGITFMVDGKMCISAGNDRIMCRIDPALQDEVLQKKGVQPVIMKGREYKGYAYVNEKSLGSKEDLEYWVKLCLDFNENAKATPKKKKAVKKAAGKLPRKN